MNFNKIEIPLNKVTIALLFLGSLLFVAGCYYMILDSLNITKKYTTNSIFLLLIGILGLIIFGSITYYAFFKLFDKKPGILINEKGIYDNSSAVSLGLIKWLDIKDISTTRIGSTKFILIHVNNPEYYIQNITGIFKRKMVVINNKMYNTPITISTIALKYDFFQLEHLLKTEFKKRKTNF